MAQRGKTSRVWFYGFKLHLIVNDRGELVSFCLTPGNVDDRKPVPQLAKALWGKLFGDRGYLAQSLFEHLFAQDLQLITPLRKNMTNTVFLPVICRECSFQPDLVVDTVSASGNDITV